MSKDVRERFEETRLEVLGFIDKRKNPQNDYVDCETQQDWVLWQAASAELEALKSDIDDALRDLTARQGHSDAQYRVETISSTLSAQSAPKQTVMAMVDAFLGWPLPKDFAPDCGISFTKKVREGTEHEHEYNPIGTNLFNADQAKEMVEYMLLAAHYPPDRIKELEKDAARLDFLSNDENIYWIHIQTEPHGFDLFCSGQVHELRKAIDQAINETKES